MSLGLIIIRFDGVACCGFTDTAALTRPDEIWGGLIGAGVSVVQTDLAGEVGGRDWMGENPSGLGSVEG